MRNDRDTSVSERMIKYCEDVEVLLERFDRSFDNYTNDISFQYGALFERIDNIILKCYHLNIKGVLPVTVDQLLLSIKNAAKRIRS